MKKFILAFMLCAGCVTAQVSGGAKPPVPADTSNPDGYYQYSETFIQTTPSSDNSLRMVFPVPPDGSPLRGTSLNPRAIYNHPVNVKIDIWVWNLPSGDSPSLYLHEYQYNGALDKYTLVREIVPRQNITTSSVSYIFTLPAAHCVYLVIDRSHFSWNSYEGFASVRVTTSILYSDRQPPNEIPSEKFLINGNNDPRYIRQNGNPPKIEILEGAYSAGNYTYSLPDETVLSTPDFGFSKFSYRVDNGPAMTTTKRSFSISDVLSSGTHSISISTVDAAGNVSPACTKTFIVDDTPPSVPSALRCAPYIRPGDDDAAFSWNASSDGAGVGGVMYDCILSGPGYDTTLATTETEVSLSELPGWASGLTEGSYTLKLRAKDSLGNTSGWSPDRTFTIDGTAPAAPANLGVSCTEDGALVTAVQAGTARFAVRRGDALEISWSCPDEAGEEASGIGRFTVLTAPAAEPAGWNTAVTLENPDFTDTAHRVTVNLSGAFQNPGNEVRLKIAAADRAGNVSESGEITVVLDTASPVPEVTTGPPLTEKSDAVVWNPVDDAGAGVREYLVTLENPAVKPGAGADRLLTLVVDTDGTIRSLSDHTPVGLNVWNAAAQRYAVPVSAFETVYGLHCIKTGIPYGGSVRSVDRLGNVSPEGAAAGAFSFTLDNLPILRSVEDGTVSLSSGPADGGVYAAAAEIPHLSLSTLTDPQDGDFLELSISLGSPHGTYTTEFLSGPIAIPEDFPDLPLADGRYTMTAMLRECIETFTADGAKTVVRKPPVSYPGLTGFSYDGTAPLTPTLSIPAPSGAEPGWTNRNVIEARVSSLEDATSGIASIELRNLDRPAAGSIAVTLPAAAADGTVDLGALLSHDPAALAAVQNGAVVRLNAPSPVVLHSNLSVLNWPLSPGDGEKHIGVTVLDRAGNAAAAPSSSVVFDSVPPQPPSALAYEFGRSNDGSGWDASPDETVRLIWSPPNDPALSRFRVMCRIGGEECPVLEIPAGGGTPRSAVLAADPARDQVAWNAPVAAEIVAVDRAGNLSAPAEWPEFHTRAMIGTLRTSGSTDRLVREPDGAQCLMLGLADPGLAFSRSVAQTITVFLNDVPCAEFRLTPEAPETVFEHVVPHDTGYRYRVTAENASGAVFGSEFRTLPEIPNLPPELTVAPELLGAESDSGRYTGPVIGLPTSSLPSRDLEGDRLEYLFELVRADSGASAEVPFDTDTGQVNAELDSFFGPHYIPDGTRLLWALTVTDGRGGQVRVPAAHDPRYSLTLDRTPPEFAADPETLLESGAGGAVGAPALKIESITDPEVNGAASGLEGSVRYTFTPVSDSGESGEPIESAVPVIGSGATVPLPHGAYTLLLAAADRVMNIRQENLGVLTVDRVAPRVLGPGSAHDSGTRIGNLRTAPDGRRFLSTGLVELRFSAVDPLTDDAASDPVSGLSTGIRFLRYWFTDKDGRVRYDASGSPAAPYMRKVFPYAEGFSASLERGLDRTVALECGFLTDGVEYELHLAVEDWAGNVSEPCSVGLFTPDRTGPGIAAFSVEGKLSPKSGGLFAASLRSLVPSYTLSPAAEAEESGIEEIRYGVLDTVSGRLCGATEPDGGWKGSLSAVTGLADGGRYRVGLRITNGAGLRSERFDSEELVFDSSAPVTPSVTVSPGGLCIPGGTVSVRIRSNDPHSGISRVMVSVFSAETGAPPVPVISESDLLLPYRFDQDSGWFVRDPCAERDTVFAFRLPASVPEGRYRAAVRVMNSAGHEASWGAEFSVLDTSGPFVNVPGPWSTSADAFRFSWGFADSGDSAPERYRYTLYRIDPGTGDVPVRSGEIPGSFEPGSVYAIQALELESGSRYAVELEVLFESGLMVSGRSIDVGIDRSPPEFRPTEDGTGLSIPGYSRGGSLTVGWNAVDPESGIGHVTVRLFSFLPPAIPRAVLETLVSGSVGAGSPEEIYRFYEPAAGADPEHELYVLRGTASGSVYARLTEDERAVVRAFFMAARYEHDVLGGPVSLPAGNGPAVCGLSRGAASEPLELETGDEIYVRLTVENSAGAAAERVAGPVIIDRTPPPEPEVIPASLYYNDSQPLEASWTVRFDPESGIESYFWTLLTDLSDAALETASWHRIWSGSGQPEPLVPVIENIENPGTGSPAYYIAVKAVNRAGGESVGVGPPVVIDPNAPRIPNVRVLRAVPGGAEYERVSFVASCSGLTLYAHAFDPESPIGTLSFDSGTAAELPPGAGLLAEPLYTAPVPPEDAPHDVERYLPLSGGQTSELSRDPEQPTMFRVRSENLARLAGLALSPGVVCLPGAPRIVSISGYAALKRNSSGVPVPDALHFTWHLASGGVEALRYTVRLIRNGQYLDPLSGVACGADRSCSRTVTECGVYRLEVTAHGINGLSAAALSGEVLVTVSPPDVSFTDAPRFVDETLELHAELRGTSDASGVPSAPLLPSVSEYRYRFGSFENRDAYTGGWKTVTSGSAAHLPDERFHAAVSSAPHGSAVYGSVRVKNSLGLWTEVECPVVRIDHTKPELLSFTVQSRYTNAPRTLSGLSFSAEDCVSGIRAWELGILEDCVGAEIVWSETDRGMYGRDEEPHTVTKGQVTVSLPGDLSMLSEGVRYLPALRFRNGAGTLSEVFYGTPVLIDRTAPALHFTPGAEAPRYTDSAGDTVYVENGPPFAFPFSITDTLCAEGASVSYRVLSETGSKVHEDGTPEPVQTGTVFYGPASEQVPYGVYRIEADSVDSAGNRSAAVLLFRYNSPPVFSLPDPADTVPGKPVVLRSNEFLELGLDYPLRYTWKFGDTDAEGRECLETGTMPAPEDDRFSPLSVTLASSEHRYRQNGAAPAATLTVELTISDRWGAEASRSAPVTIRTSVTGELYADEIWSGNCVLTGPVTVPDGVCLTILPGTSVRFPDGGSLLVRGTLHAEADPSAPIVFDSLSASSTLDWAGIRIEDASAVLSSVRVSHALRGLTAGPGSAANITDSEFTENRVGLHAWGAAPLVRSTCFVRNEWYAVKEDAAGAYGGLRPRLEDCRFTDNGYDYYHEAEGPLEPDEIDGIEGNHGNREGE